jgi:methyl-accepting chemotaxis protein
MNMLANLKIPTKILLLLLLLGAVTVTVALWASRTLATEADANVVMVGEAKAPLYLSRASRAGTVMIYNGYRVMTHDGASREAREGAAAAQQAYESGREMLAKAVAARPSLKAEVGDFEIQFDAIRGLAQQAIRLGLANKNTEATALLTDADVKVTAFAKRVTASNAAIIAADEAQSAALTATAKSASFWLLTLSIVGVAVSIGTSLLVSRIGITGPLAMLKAAMEKLAGGDNDVDIKGADRRDEVGDMAKVVLVFRATAIAKAVADADKAEADATLQMVVTTMGENLTDLSNRDLTCRVTVDFPSGYALLKDRFNDAIDQVRTTVQQVTESAANIRTGSNEIAQASEDLARRTEGNAASLEETSAALVQIDGRLKATSQSSTQTVARADQAIATVNGGRATAEEAVQAMGRVSDSAKGIDSVIEGLDKIAFQTRVLAMNAAVEAGRAGDAGRGFAVVADLVSALAMRAEEEAKRARDQLTLTQTDIVTAVQAVQKVDGALANISSDVDEVHKLLGTMADDASAQSTAITQISAAIGAMDQSTQQNAAMVEQTSAAARNLTAEVTALADQAAMFKTEEAHVRRTPPQRVAPPQPAQRQAANKPASGYRSPIKALPAAVARTANASAGHDDWNAF